MCRRKFEDEQTRPDYDRKANKKIRKPFRLDSGHGEGFKGNRVYRYRYRYIYIGSRRPEVAGQLISHFFDEDSRNSRCSLCRDTSSNNFFELQPPREPTVENRTSKKGNEVESNKTGVQADLLVRRTPSSFPSKFC